MILWLWTFLRLAMKPTCGDVRRDRNCGEGRNPTEPLTPHASLSLRISSMSATTLRRSGVASRTPGSRLEARRVVGLVADNTTARLALWEDTFACDGRAGGGGGRFYWGRSRMCLLVSHAAMLRRRSRLGIERRATSGGLGGAPRDRRASSSAYQRRGLCALCELETASECPSKRLAQRGKGFPRA